jgi:hypothetical protein
MAVHCGSKYGIEEFLEVKYSVWAASTGKTGGVSCFEPTVPTEIAGAEQLH